MWDSIQKQVPDLLQKHLPALLWFILVLGLLLVFNGRLRRILSLIEWRLKAGVPIKVSAFELGAVQIPPDRKVPANPTLVRPDKTGEFKAARQHIRDLSLFLVHRLSPSATVDQLYDVVIYVVTGLKGGTILNINRVEYYFGEYWNKNIYTSVDRSSGFSISTSAFAPFTCTAKIIFSDGNTTMIHRYVDFEMGNLGGPRPAENPLTKHAE